MASVSTYTTVILVCPAVLVAPSTSFTTSIAPSTTTSASVTSSTPSISSAEISQNALLSTTTSPTTSASSSGMTQTPPPYVVVPVHTTLTINVFPSNHPSPDYVPKYEVHADGSMTTSLFDAKVDSQYLELVFVGVYLCIFTYTLWKSFSYLRRAGPNARSIFGILSLSQFLGLTAVLSVGFGFFDSSANCQAINFVAAISGEISYALIVTGILGFKIYRILSRQKAVLIIIVLLQLVSIGLFIGDLPGMSPKRGFSGECAPAHDLHYIPWSMVVLFIEAIFITMCFMYAIRQAKWNIAPPIEQRSGASWWRRKDRSRSRSRSIGASDGNMSPTSQPPLTPIMPTTVPVLNRHRAFSDSPSVRLTLANKMSHAFQQTRSLLTSRHGSVSNSTPDSTRRTGRTSDTASRNLGDALGSTHSQRSIGGGSRHRFTKMGVSPVDAAFDSTVDMAGPRERTISRVSGIEEHGVQVIQAGVRDNIEEKRSSRVDEFGVPIGVVRPRPPGATINRTNAMGSVKTLSTRIIHSSRTIFRRVLRDELLSTAAISIVILASTLLSFIGSWGHHQLLGPSLLLDGGWAVVSLLILRSFGGVIRRAERSALLREHWENMHNHRGAGLADYERYDPTQRLGRGDTLSNLVFANPDVIEEEDEDEARQRGSRVHWQDPYFDSERQADIEAWRRPRGPSDSTTSSALSPRSDEETSPNLLSKKRQVLKRPKPTMSPPSFSSFSSYWASRSDGLDGLRRASVVQSLVHVDEHAHEDDLDLDPEHTPMPGARMIRERDIGEPEDDEKETGYHTLNLHLDRAASLGTKTEPGIPSPRTVALRHSRAVSAPTVIVDMPVSPATLSRPTSGTTVSGGEEK